MSSYVETHPVFVRLAEQLMPRLKEAELRLKSMLPDAVFSVFSGPLGAATSFNGAHLGIECLLPMFVGGIHRGMWRRVFPVKRARAIAGHLQLRAASRN